MRLYYIPSGILLILPIIDFAVAAPVPVQEKFQARVNLMDIPEGAMTTLERPKELPATNPSSSSQSAGPADGPTDVKQPLPSMLEEPSPGSRPDQAALSKWYNKMWVNLVDHPGSQFLPKPDGLPATHPSSSLSPAHPLQSLGDELNKMWVNLVGDPGPDEELWADLLDHPVDSSAAHPSWGLPPSGPTHEWTHFDQWLPSLTEETSSLDHAPPSPELTGSGYDFMKGDEPRWPSFPASSTISSADGGLMGAHAVPKPAPSTDHEMMDATINP
jgi:hypothetical protein